MAENPTSMPNPGAGNVWYGTPQQLLARDELSREEKIEVLRQWELDLRERMVADDENMAATEPDAVTLDDVLKAMHQLGAVSSKPPCANHVRLSASGAVETWYGRQYIGSSRFCGRDPRFQPQPDSPLLMTLSGDQAGAGLTFCRYDTAAINGRYERIGMQNAEKPYRVRQPWPGRGTRCAFYVLRHNVRSAISGPADCAFRTHSSSWWACPSLLLRDEQIEYGGGCAR